MNALSFSAATVFIAWAHMSVSLAQQAAESDLRSLYYVQYGAYTQEVDATMLKSRLASAAVETKITSMTANDGRVVYRVRQGPFPERDIAFSVQEQAEKDWGINARVVRVDIAPEPVSQPPGLRAEATAAPSASSNVTTSCDKSCRFERRLFVNAVSKVESKLKSLEAQIATDRDKPTWFGNLKSSDFRYIAGEYRSLLQGFNKTKQASRATQMLPLYQSWELYLAASATCYDKVAELRSLSSEYFPRTGTAIVGGPVAIASYLGYTYDTVKASLSQTELCEKAGELKRRLANLGADSLVNR